MAARRRTQIVYCKKSHDCLQCAIEILIFMKIETAWRARAGRDNRLRSLLDVDSFNHAQTYICVFKYALKISVNLVLHTIIYVTENSTRLYIVIDN